MGERYFITGVQIGLLLSLNKNGQTIEIIKLLRKIEDEQFIGNVQK